MKRMNDLGHTASAQYLNTNKHHDSDKLSLIGKTCVNNIDLALVKNLRSQTFPFPFQYSILIIK